MTDPRSFGAWLRRERERRTITLRAIADRTKIGTSLLEALERGDVSRWPGGIYRRAFVRSYAEAIGVDAELVLANFERVFPAEGSGAAAPATPAAPQQRPHDEDEPRMSLAAPAAVGVTSSALRTAAVDLGVVAGFGLAGLAAAGMIGFWCAIAVSATVFYVTRVLGLERLAGRLASGPGATATVEAPPRAEVLSFQTEQERANSRRARARRVLTDLSAAATSGSLPGRRRAARS